MLGVSPPKERKFNAGTEIKSSSHLLYIRRYMLKFYDINENYVRYLQTIDDQVPNIHYSTNNKFVCGVVLNINGVDYYAPISHTTKKYQTSLLIYNESVPISSIRFSFMIPAYDEVLTELKFSEISKRDEKYADLIKVEYDYCKNNKTDIYEKAKAVYKIGCNKNHRLNYTCCNFKRLESEYMKYKYIN